jgi:hypothetical protein
MKRLSALSVMVMLVVFGASGICLAAEGAQTCTKPSVSTLEAPVNVAKTTTPTYQWTAVSGATWYRLWVSDAAGKIFDKWYTASQVACVPGVGSCFVTPSATLATGWASFWIDAWNSCGDKWSEEMKFKVSSGAPIKPTILGPAGPTGVHLSPTYKWIASYNASSYRLWVRDSSGNVVIDKWYTTEEVSCPTGLGACSISPSVTLNLGWGVVYVDAYNIYGEAWSDAMWFKVTTP